MLADTIPQILFEKKNHVEMEFEILTLESLFSRPGKVRQLLEKPHRVEFYNILYMERKAGVHFIDFHFHPFQEGSLIFVSKGQVQSFEVDPGREGFLILFTENFMSKNLIHSDLLSLHRLYNYHLHTPVIGPGEMGKTDFGALVREMFAEYEFADAFAKEDILRLLLKLLLLKAQRVKNTMIPRHWNRGQLEKFTTFKNLVETHFQETRNAKNYASMMQMSYKRLNEIVRYVSGKTAKEFIDSCVVLEIKRRLATTDFSVKELTDMFGFDEPTNFVKFFKKRARKTPSEFRRILSN